MIRDHFWENLTRRIDASTVDIAARDPKDWTADPRPRIYIPYRCPRQYEFYKRVAEERPEMRLDVQMLPEKITPDLNQSTLRDGLSKACLSLSQVAVSTSFTAGTVIWHH
ncbi:hypothetical protein LB505_006577 [Fusarium chuoi]|nr:hypothetical protein LB505_006577 [Fusarium chuoi]